MDINENNLIKVDNAKANQSVIFKDGKAILIGINNDSNKIKTNSSDTPEYLQNKFQFSNVPENFEFK
jgi:hypothetical protein